MDLTRLPDLRTALSLAGIKPNKHLGQHFLIDAEARDAVIDGIGPHQSDTVLEVGPGLGVMTTALAARVGTLVAVEADPTLAQLLERDAPGNLRVVGTDILRFDLTELPASYKVAANIPYYLTSRLIRVLLESPAPPSVMSLLIQKEVAERIVAEPGAMSMLALSVQYYATAKITRAVPRTSFWPAPIVDSSVIVITRRPQPAFAADRSGLSRLMEAGFGEKRKQLRNSLAGGLGLSPEQAVALIDASELPPTARAQELSLKAWERLYRQAQARGYVA